MPNVYLVTVKLPKNPEHDPRDKKTGPCPVFKNQSCTDATGEHHTGMMVTTRSRESVRDYFEQAFGHVTRIEQYMGGTATKCGIHCNSHDNPCKLGPGHNGSHSCSPRCQG